ncbi:MAG: adenosylcobinamide-phosphate synthase CbiB [Candidatus Ratteibacteria bacterium]|jgi:adenosylcobinamide-phosphate synthase
MGNEGFVFHNILLIVLAYLADLLFGDPVWFPHPVRGMGKLITRLEKYLRRGGNRKNEKAKGIVLFFLVVGISSSFSFVALKFCTQWSSFLGDILWIYLSYTVLATKDLRTEAREVFRELKTGSLIGARRKLSRIVGRDTAGLSEEKIIVATVESVAESTNDGIVAPLLYLCLGGPVLAIAYKAVNTLDSMVGHRNDKYLNFGWFSARMDDVANFIPARLTGLLVSFSSLLTGRGFRKPFSTIIQDGRKHLSPNSGISEAAMAGALGIRLGGCVSYDGELFERPYLGEERKKPVPSQIKEAIKISFVSSVLALLLGVLLRWLIY